MENLKRVAQTAVVSVLLLLLIVLILDTTANAVMKKAETNVVATIKSYPEFYKAVNDCILNKTSGLELKIIGYNEKIFKESNVINSVMKKNLSLKHIVSSISLSKQKTGNTTSLKYKFGYTSCEFVAASVTEFNKAIIKALDAKKPEINIKVINYTKAYSLEGYNNYVAKQGLQESSILGTAKLTMLKNLCSAAYVISTARTGKENPGIAATQKSPAAPSVKVESSKQLELTSADEVSTVIEAALKNMDPVIEFKISNLKQLSFEKIGKLTSEAISAYHEQGYFNGWEMSFLPTGSNTGNIKIDLKLNFPKSKILLMEQATKKKIEAIIAANINERMSEYDKILAIHDYIVNNTQYDYSNLLKNTIPKESYMAYGVLVNGIGVCSGYAKAFQMLMNAAGLECIIVNGTANGVINGPHSWNIIKIYNKYYHVDTTFDDPIVKGSDKSVIRHTYFILNDKEISKDHTWDKSKYPSCSSNDFSYKGNGINNNNK